VRQQVKLFQEKVSIDFSANFILQNSKNRPVAGNFANPVRSLYLMPRNADVKYFENNSETWGQLYYINEMNGFYKKASTKGPIQQWPWINAEVSELVVEAGKTTSFVTQIENKTAAANQPIPQNYKDPEQELGVIAMPHYKTTEVSATLEPWYNKLNIRRAVQHKDNNNK
jgi:hypothetical protein